MRSRSRTPKTLVLNLKEAQVAVPEHLFHYPFLMLDPAENGAFAVGSNGTGSFELVELEVGRKAVLKRRPDAPGYLDELQFIDLGDNPSAVAAALASKQVDGIYQGNIEQFDLYKGMDHVDIHDSGDGADRRRAHAASTRSPSTIRQCARPCALPPIRRSACRSRIRVSAKPAEHHHVCTVHPDYKKIEPPWATSRTRPRSFWPMPASRMASTSKSTASPIPSWEQAAVEAMAEQWKAGGHPRQDQRAAIGEVLGSVGRRCRSASPNGPIVRSASWCWRSPIAPACRGTSRRYSNKQFDELLSKAEGTLDVDKRREIIGELEKIMLEDGPITQPLWRSVYAAYDKRVKGFQIHPTLYIFGETLAIKPA